MTSWVRRMAALFTLPLLLGLAACGGHTAAPAPNAEPVPAPRLPPRPAALQLDHVDPCALLSETERGQLGLNPGQFKYEDASTRYPLCRWDNFPHQPNDGYLARLQLNQGAEFALDSATGHEIVQVDRFAAVQTTAGGLDPRRHCILLVDVALGQSLWVQFSTYGTNGRNAGLTHEMSCQFARAFGENLVRNLRAQAR